MFIAVEMLSINLVRENKTIKIVQMPHQAEITC